MVGLWKVVEWWKVVGLWKVVEWWTVVECPSHLKVGEGFLLIIFLKISPNFSFT
jgi:hypothetical protein